MYKINAGWLAGNTSRIKFRDIEDAWVAVYGLDPMPPAVPVGHSDHAMKYLAEIVNVPEFAISWDDSEDSITPYVYRIGGIGSVRSAGDVLEEISYAHRGTRSAVLELGDGHHRIASMPDGVAQINAVSGSNVVACGDAVIHASDGASVWAWEDSTIHATGEAQIWAYDRASVFIEHADADVWVCHEARGIVQAVIGHEAPNFDIVKTVTTRSASGNITYVSSLI